MRAGVLNPSISHCTISVCAAGNKQKGLLNLQFRGRQLLFALSLLKGLSPRLFPAAQRELPAHCLIRSVSQNRAQLSMLTFSAINCQPKPTKSSLMVRQAVFSSYRAVLLAQLQEPSLQLFRDRSAMTKRDTSACAELQPRR